MKKFIKYLLTFVLLFTIVGCGKTENSNNGNNNGNIEEGVATDTFNGVDYTVYEGEPYNTKYEVAIYIHYFKELPVNYYTKYEAQSMDFQSDWTKENKLAIGGNKFHNREGRLPDSDDYIECDIDTVRTRRGSKRIVYDSVTLKVYYTGDHYGSFEELY